MTNLGDGFYVTGEAGEGDAKAAFTFLWIPNLFGS